MSEMYNYLPKSFDFKTSHRLFFGFWQGGHVFVSDVGTIFVSDVGAVFVSDVGTVFISGASEGMTVVRPKQMKERNIN